ncbi:MAG: DUF5752 family protein [Nitrospiraceae bacterium]|nr:DUF5752 family protein [Nitrospiraceae bacterium]
MEQQNFQERADPQLPSNGEKGRFDFRECRKLIMATGRKARNLTELHELIGSASANSIYHHTYEFFFKGHILEYTNDFAQWVGAILEARVLSENLSNIDPFRDTASLDSLREELLGSISRYIKKYGDPGNVLPGEEFYFQESVTVVFPAGFRALNLAEFLMAMRFVDQQSIYYHFFEGRSRVPAGIDDFSKWVEDTLGKKELALHIRSIDPFMHSIEGIRGQIVSLIENALREEIEVG